MSYGNYSIYNVLAVNYAAFACICMVVFLSSTQPFFISSLFKVDEDDLANIIGTLGFADELVAMAFAPVVGIISDYINHMRSLRLSGPRVVQSSGFVIMAFALFGYSHWASSVFPHLLLYRCVFAIGATSCLSMITVFLNEMALSQYASAGGKQAALVGVSSGIGAIAAVSLFLTLPANLTEWIPSLSIQQGLQWAFTIVSLFAVGLALLAFRFLYDWKRSSSQSVRGEYESLDTVATLHDHTPSQSQYNLFTGGLVAAGRCSTVQLSFMGAFLARATSVALSVFVPLLVYHFYSQTGRCTVGKVPSKANCRDGYVFAAILTGVSQTVGLVLAPIWGVLADSRRVGKRGAMLWASIVGAIGCFALCTVPRTPYTSAHDLRNAWAFCATSLIGAAQIGAIVTSMSMLSSARALQSMGGLSGLYSFFGGVGILVITKGGAAWSSHWSMGPFMLLGLCYLTVIGATTWTIIRDAGVEQ